MATRSAKRSDKKIQEDRTEQIMNLVARKAAYYRSNPHRFAEEVLGVRLKLFQKILLWALNYYYYFFYVAARGQGKTYLVALFCCIRCILYPGTKIVVCSATRRQGNEVLLKIQDDFMKTSAILKSEIEKCNVGQNEAAIYFKNHSWIRVATASDSGRGLRANCIVVDESRMVARKIIQDVIKKFMTAERQPGYLSKKEYADLTERNKEIYMSSAYFQDSEMYEQAYAYTINFFDDTKRYWICGLPYQISIKEHLLNPEQVRDEMSETTFSDISWSMEMECLFYSCGDDAFFNYSTLVNRRRINQSFYPLEVYRNKNLKVPDLLKGEERILSVDVALMASKRHANDASALSLLSCVPTNGDGLTTNLVYLETAEGLTADDLSLLIMRFYYQYKCTQLAIDGSGVGQPIIDLLMVDRYDPMYGITYPGLNCCNNADIESRCKTKGAAKVIWAMKANANTNNDMYLSLRSGFQNGNINLLVSEETAEDFIKKTIKGFNRMSPQDQASYRVAYMQTTLLIEELAKLDHRNHNGNIKIKERSNMRKDRVSSILYGYYVAQQLSYKKKKNIEVDIVKLLPARRGKRFSSL